VPELRSGAQDAKQSAIYMLEDFFFTSLASLALWVLLESTILISLVAFPSEVDYSMPAIFMGLRP
jgi:hypothetical protein